MLNSNLSLFRKNSAHMRVSSLVTNPLTSILLSNSVYLSQNYSTYYTFPSLNLIFLSLFISCQTEDEFTCFILWIIYVNNSGPDGSLPLRSYFSIINHNSLPM